MDVNTDFLKVDGKVYRVEHVADNLDIEAALKAYYEARVQSLTQSFQRENADALSEEYRTLHDHIYRQYQRRTNRGMRVPENQQTDHMHYAYDGRLYEARAMVYRPCAVRMSVGQLVAVLGHEHVPPDMDEDSPEDLMVYLKCPFYRLIVLGYNEAIGKLKCFVGATHHTMSYKEVCTGNAPASTFWALQRATFERAINTLNRHSFASSSLRMVDERSGNVSIVRFNMLMCESTITNVTLASGGDTWNS